jgi:hypothetical protein
LIASGPTPNEVAWAKDILTRDREINHVEHSEAAAKRRELRGERRALRARLIDQIVVTSPRAERILWRKTRGRKRVPNAYTLLALVADYGAAPPSDDLAQRASDAHAQGQIARDSFAPYAALGFSEEAMPIRPAMPTRPTGRKAEGTQAEAAGTAGDTNSRPV